MPCRNCVGADCNRCLFGRTIKTGLVFFAMSTTPVCAITGTNPFVRTAVFMAIIFLIMKLSKMRSGYRTNELDMSRSAAYYTGANQMITGEQAAF